MVIDRPVIRRFTLGDSMILVAAIAVGVAWSQTYQAVRDRLAKSPAARGSLSRPKVAHALPLLASLTLAVPLLQWRHSPGRFRRLTRLPGIAACHAAGVGIGLAVVTSLYDMARSVDPERVPIYLLIMVHRLLSYPAPAVAAVWVTMWLDGRWRRQTDWLDRFGRVLGLLWILGFLLVELQIGL